MDEIFEHFRYCNMIARDTNDTSEVRRSLQEMRYREHWSENFHKFLLNSMMDLVELIGLNLRSRMNNISPWQTEMFRLVQVSLSGTC